MTDRLESGWDGLSTPVQQPPVWLEKLALQLELWIGNAALSRSPYLKISYEPPTEEAWDGQPANTPSNALLSESLFLRAITREHFVAVDVRKAAGDREAVSADMVVHPRDHLTQLSATEIVMRGPSADAIRLRLEYSNGTEYLLPHDDSYDEEWREAKGIEVFKALRGDLWQAPSLSGRAYIDIQTTSEADEIPR